MLNTPSPSTYTLITGASKGLGKALAFELAKRKVNLFLISLPGEGLEELALALRKETIEVLVKELDISQTHQVEEFSESISQQYRLSGLINNAGLGGDAYFLDENIADMRSMLAVNVIGVVLFTRALLPLLLKEEQSYILNICSLAAFSPIAYKSVYPATKSFLHQFTLGLQEEFKKRNILISMVHPGPMRTNSEISKRLKDRDFFTRQLTLLPGEAAEIIIRKLFQGRKIIYLHFWQRFAFVLLKIVPQRLSLILLSKISRKELKSEQ